MYISTRRCTDAPLEYRLHEESATHQQAPLVDTACKLAPILGALSCYSTLHSENIGNIDGMHQDLTLTQKITGSKVSLQLTVLSLEMWLRVV